MCYAKSTGKGRCDCDSSEKRKLRYHNKEALDRYQKQDGDVFTTKGNSTPQPTSQPVLEKDATVQNVHKIRDEIASLQKQYEAHPEDSEVARNILIHVERKVVQAGGIVAKMIELYDQKTIVETVRASNSYSQQITQNIQKTQKNIKRLEEAIIKGNQQDSRFLATKQGELDSARQLLEWDEADYGRALSNRDVRNIAISDSHAESTIAVLKTIRSFGGTLQARGGTKALEKLEMASNFFPTDWIKKSNDRNELIVGEPVTAERIVGAGQYKDILEKKDKDDLKKYSLSRPLRFMDSIEKFSSLEVRNTADTRIYPVSSDVQYHELSDVIKERVRQTKATWIHELTHRMEYVNGHFFAKTEETFLLRRTTQGGKREKPVVKKIRISKKEEKPLFMGITVYEDSFVSTYMGRPYSGRAWEVLSVSAGAIFGGDSGNLIGLGSTEPDEDARRFTLGMWATL